MTGPQVLPKRETQQERKTPMLGKFAFWELQGRDRQNASANKLRHGRPPPKKGPPKSSTRSLLATRKERRLRKHFGGFEDEEFKGSFYLARCFRCREPERRSGCGWRGRGRGETQA